MSIGTITATGVVTVFSATAYDRRNVASVLTKQSSSSRIASVLPDQSSSQRRAA